MIIGFGLLTVTGIYMGFDCTVFVLLEHEFEITFENFPFKISGIASLI